MTVQRSEPLLLYTRASFRNTSAQLLRSASPSSRSETPTATAVPVLSTTYLVHSSTFTVQLSLTSNTLAHDFLRGNQLLVGGPTAAVGLFKLVKWLRGRDPDTLREDEDGILLQVEKLRLKVPTEVVRLWSDRALKEQLEAFVRPLQRKGADRVVFKDDERELESVARDEAEYFNTEYEDGDETKYIIPRQRLQIASLTFNKGKWRLSDGGNVRWYAMEDRGFTDSIDKGARFGKDDILVCEVLMTQRLDDSGKLKLEYAVRRVLQHITPGQQLPFSEGENEREQS